MRTLAVQKVAARASRPRRNQASASLGQCSAYRAMADAAARCLAEKTAGNAAFGAGDFAEAVSRYSAALECEPLEPRTKVPLPRTSRFACVHA